MYGNFHIKKWSFVFVLLCVLHCSAWGQSGVNFEQLSFDEALNKAKSENKLLFVDCYTSWCGPCKHMAEKVFTLKEAGDFFNPIFISVKYDMEKGEGKELARRFHIRAYPTFLIIQSDGSVQHKIVGGGELDEFISKVKQGINPNTSLAYLSKIHEQGKIKKQQLILYQAALINAMETEKSKIVAKELEENLTPADKIDKVYWNILKKSEYGSPDYYTLLNNLSSFYHIVGKREVDQYITNSIFTKLRLGDVSPTTLKQMQQDLSSLQLTNQTLLCLNVDLALASVEHDIKTVISWAKRVKSNSNGELWTTFNAINAIRSYASPKELRKLVKLKRQFLKAVPENSSEYVNNYIETLKKDISDKRKQDS